MSDIPTIYDEVVCACGAWGSPKCDCQGVRWREIAVYDDGFKWVGRWWGMELYYEKQRGIFR